MYLTPVDVGLPRNVWICPTNTWHTKSAWNACNRFNVQRSSLAFQQDNVLGESWWFSDRLTKINQSNCSKQSIQSERNCSLDLQNWHKMQSCFAVLSTSTVLAINLHLLVCQPCTPYAIARSWQSMWIRDLHCNRSVDYQTNLIQGRAALFTLSSFSKSHFVLLSLPAVLHSVNCNSQMECPSCRIL